MVTRREALRRLGLMAAGTVGIGELACAQTDVVTGPLGPLGVQLYTLRREMAQSVDATLARVAEIGYSEVEFAGYFGRSPAEIRSGLAAAGLSSPAAHVDINAVIADWPHTLDIANTIGHRYLVVPSVPPEMRVSLDHWRAVADIFNRAGDEARRAGIRIKKSKETKHRFVHTLNGSGLALPRVIAAILEMHQTPTGRVRIPEKLRAYMGGQDYLG
ncbi:MAG: hypothetical protein IIA17_02360 [candidate division Zixibacteria bacterium]|nr:hypothetical protein [candidate division Zixibacteria bacterium]